MSSIGEMLRAAREAQGRSIADLAKELCITERYLAALEEDDVQVLPGLFFYQSFVRQYAATLGLDDKKVNAALAEIAAPAVPVSQEIPVLPVTSVPVIASPSPGAALLERIAEAAHRMSIRGIPAGLSTAALVGALVLGAGIFAWWNRGPQTGASTASVTKSINAVPAGANGTLQTAALQTPEDPNEVVLSIMANEETWVSIASHGKVLFSGILQPSESRTLKGGEVATMKVGNAGGIDIQWNGKSIGRIGPRGQVRTVRFTSQDFHVIAPEDSESSDPPAQHDL
jgi:hypothetical protein